jgi:hypothetical protein
MAISAALRVNPSAHGVPKFDTNMLIGEALNRGKDHAVVASDAGRRAVDR